MSQLDIVNRALSRLGVTRVDALTENSKNARAVNDAWAIVRDEVLRDHPWNCATRRLALYTKTDAVEGVTLTGTRVRIALTAHDFEQDDVVSISGIVGTTEANGSWGVGNVMTDSFDLVDLDTGAFETGAGFTAYVSGGTVELRNRFGLDYRYELPADCLRVLEIDGQREDNWLVEDGAIVTDLGSPLLIRYVFRNEDTGAYEPLLVSALAARLAAEIGLEVVDSPSKVAQAWDAYREILHRAKVADAREQTPTEPDESRWVTARL